MRVRGVFRYEGRRSSIRNDVREEPIGLAAVVNKSTGQLVNQADDRSPVTGYDLAMRGLVVVAVFISACTAESATTTSTTTSTTSPSPTTAIQTALERQQAEWEALGVDGYRIEYSVANLNGMGGSADDGTYTLAVVDGLIESCELEPRADGRQDCEDFVGLPDPTLFSWANRFDSEHTTIAFDPQWHLPSRISYDDPESIDEEYLVELIHFEPRQ
jgi:hypothetical protein